MRIGLVLNRQALAFEIVQAGELKPWCRHHGITQLKKPSGFFQAPGFVISIRWQCKDSVTFVDGIAQGAALVKGKPPSVVNRRGVKALGH